MACISNIAVEMPDIANKFKITLNIKAKGLFKFRFRKWILFKLLKLCGFISPVEMEIKLKKKDK
jgi:hypothetical protein